MSTVTPPRRRPTIPARRHQLAQAQRQAFPDLTGDTAPARPDYGRRSWSGTQISGGRIYGIEQNADLRGTAWAQTEAEMRRTDSAVAALCMAVENTLLSARFTFRAPEGAQPRGREAADFLNTAFGLNGQRGEMAGTFESFLAQAVRFVSTGFRYFEVVWKVADKRVWVHELADCDPTAHQEWVTNPRTQRLEGITQKAAFGVSTPGAMLPADKMLLLTLNRTGANFEGAGMLRPTYFPHKLKRHTMDMLGIAVERWAVGTPYGEIDYRQLTESSGYTDADVTTLISNAAAQLKSYTSSEIGYLMMPAGIKLDRFGGDLDPAGAQSVLQMCNQEIFLSGLVQFILLGVNDTGSRAVGDVQESFFRRACVNYLDNVASGVGGKAGVATGIAGRLLEWNFPGLPPGDTPVLEHHGLAADPLTEILGQLPALGGAGFVQPRDAVENAILTRAGLPELGPDELRSPQDRAPAQSTGAMFARMVDAARRRTSQPGD